MAAPKGNETDNEVRRQAGVVMRASQILVGIVLKSLDEVGNAVSVAQLRILVAISTRGPLPVHAVADAVGVHPSNITRACDPLVARGLLTRQRLPADRRQVRLILTEPGRELVTAVLRHRETAIAAILHRMPAHARADLEAGLAPFLTAAGEPADPR